MAVLQERFVDTWGGRDGYKWELSEGLVGNGKSEVDGKVFLGRIVGQMFVPDGVSDNERFYSRGLWEKTLSAPDLQSRLKNRLIFGKIGHEDRVVTEEDLEKGRVSHVITNLWIDDEGKGMGEALIYNTESGRNLYMYLKGGSALKPSTRANGSYLEGRDHNGVPIVDENNYIFETVDFVLYPGFRQVDMKLVENKNKINSNKKRSMDSNIDGNRILSEMIESRTRLQSDLSKAIKESSESKKQVRKLKESVTKMRGLVESKQNTISALRSKGKEVCDKAISLHNKYKQVSEQLNSYRQLGDVKQIQKKLSASTSSQKFFEGLANPAQLARQLKQMVEELRSYRRIGKPHEISRAIKLAEGTLRKYVSIGKPEEINRVVSQAEGLIRKFRIKDKRRALTSKVESYSRKYGVPVEDMRSMLESMPERKALALAESMSRRRMHDVSMKNKVGMNRSNRLAESYLSAGKSRAAAVFKNQMAPARSLFENKK